METGKRMTCDLAREQLWPPERPQVVDEETMVAREHLESCEECRRFFAMDRRLKERLGAIQLPPAPAAVRERVFDALARERARAGAHLQDPGLGPTDGNRRVMPGRFVGWPAIQGMGAAAGVIALFLGGWFFLTQSGIPQPDPAAGTLAEEVISPPSEVLGSMEDFVHRASQEERLVSSDPAAIGEFLRLAVGVEVRPANFDGFQLVAAEVCVVESKRGAVLIYERNGQLLYHYILEHDDVAPREPTLSPRAAPLRWAGTSTPSVVVWSDGAQDQALVGDLRPETILSFAQREHGGR